MKRKIVFWCIYLTLLLMAIIVFQRKIIYLPSRGEVDQKAFHAEDMTLVKLTTSDGIKLTAWYKPPSADHATLLFFGSMKI